MVLNRMFHQTQQRRTYDEIAPEAARKSQDIQNNIAG